ncbi:MAG: NusA-like transcription termination signal-binding factor [Candidatus Ranarchaeia archaeon]
MTSLEGPKTTTIKLTTDEIQYINLFERVTNTTAIDCILDTEEDRVIYVVSRGKIGLAIGQGGRNINQLKQMLGREIDLVEYSDKIEQFVRNCLNPAKTGPVTITERRNGRKIITVEIKQAKDKGIAIGKNGRNIQKARMLVSRHFGIDTIVIA